MGDLSLLRWHKSTLLLSCLLAWLLAACRPSANFSGSLLLYAYQPPDGQQGPRRGIYVLQSGSSEPQPWESASAARSSDIRAVSPDARFVLAGNKRVIDLNTGEYVEPPIHAEAWLGAFSPGGERLAYTYTGGYSQPGALYVYDIATEQATRLYEGRCATYLGDQRICGMVDRPFWIDDDTLMFAHYGDSMPSPVRSDLANIRPNRLTVMDVDGSTLQEFETEDLLYYCQVYEILAPQQSGPTLLVHDSERTRCGAPTAWLDTDELLESQLRLNPLPDGGMFSLSPDGQTLLQVGDPWRLVELRTGETTLLGTDYALEWLDRCVWAPDRSAAACVGSRRAGGNRLLLIVPFSGEGAQVALRWGRVNWTLLAWLP